MKKREQLMMMTRKDGYGKRGSNQAMTLEIYLQGSLPIDNEFEIINLQSIPRETSPIVFHRSEAGDKCQRKVTTIKTQHFITLCYKEKVVFAIEIVVFFTLSSDIGTPAEKLLFVSKADTNGYCDCRLDIGRVTKSIISYVLSISPDHYLNKVKPLKRTISSNVNIIKRSTSVRKALNILGKRRLDSKGRSLKAAISERELYASFPTPLEIVTKISLFTRAEPQYLFSNSSRNAKKHVLTGEKLLKWWLKIIDQVVVESFSDGTMATLQIPGEEKRLISNYLRNTVHRNWSVGDIFSKSPQDIALYKIPLFPDDPKGRFLDQLINDGRIYKVNVFTFWTELQARQEFRLGSTVSVIGVSGKYIGTSNEPRQFDIVVPFSKKRFKNLKNYITGEEYDTEEGAEEAYMNVRDILRTYYSANMVKITGSYIKPTPSSTEIADNANAIHTLNVQRKSK
ncbi:unnamed protein product [Kluyveromyces dobzhanskii CBS 2104]|uniref:histone acetyltransferase n=1 Tax=Kluyveromyces dobzhanskii CBS 2104 TaxID=1427455 RepID=A0A0A8L6T7_9SACH|nr:unnamed protein product [Kluyveromyces dobzhanskii CBS 2104]